MKSIWTGTISFALINITVNLYTASSEKRVGFKFLRKKDLCPIKYIKVCEVTQEKVPYNEVVRGYEIEKGNFVVMDDEDFKKADVKRSESIEISEFVDSTEIDEKYFDKPYFIEPGKGSAKAYALLRDALKKSKKVGLAKFVLKNKEHFVALQPDGDLLILNVMRFPDELRDPKELNTPGKDTKYSDKEMQIATQLISELTSKFDPKKYEDDYTEKLLKVIEQKAKGKTVKIEGGKTKSAPTKAPDIMAVLKKSLDKAREREAATKKQKSRKITVRK